MSTILTLARVCQITYANGDRYGFTTHDRPLIIDGVTFSPVEGVQTQNREESVNFASNNQEIKVVNLPPNIVDAEVISAQVDWRNLPVDLDAVPTKDKQIGVVGEVKYDGAVYTVEVISKISSLLNQSVSVKTGPNCRFNFCDSRCGLNIATYSRESTVVSVIDDHEFSIGGVYNRLSWGYLNFLTGDNQDTKYPIFEGYPDGANTRIVLRTYTKFPIAIGDEIKTFDGCAKTAEACESDYGNLLNFGGWLSGENYMPGNKFYLASPKYQR